MLLMTLIVSGKIGDASLNSVNLINWHILVNMLCNICLLHPLPLLLELAPCQWGSHPDSHPPELIIMRTDKHKNGPWQLD